jgi:hypothetical protein
MYCDLYDIGAGHILGLFLTPLSLSSRKPVQDAVNDQDWALVGYQEPLPGKHSELQGGCCPCSPHQCHQDGDHDGQEEGQNCASTPIADSPERKLNVWMAMRRASALS